MTPRRKDKGESVKGYNAGSAASKPTASSHHAATVSKPSSLNGAPINWIPNGNPSAAAAAWKTDRRQAR